MRIAASEVVSIESSGSFGYDFGVISENWEIPAMIEKREKAWRFEHSRHDEANRNDQDKFVCVLTG